MFAHTLNDITELRMLEQQHAQELFVLIQQNRGRLRQWVPWLHRTSSFERTQCYIRDHLDRYADNNGFAAGIWFKGQLAGEIRYEYIDWQNKTTEIGYWVGQDFEGKGLVIESCKKFVAYAFECLKLNRVQIRCATENERSRAIPERLGFTEEGILRQSEWLERGFVDLVVYGLLADEWKAATSD